MTVFVILPKTKDRIIVPPNVPFRTCFSPWIAALLLLTIPSDTMSFSMRIPLSRTTRPTVPIFRCRHTARKTTTRTRTTTNLFWSNNDNNNKVDKGFNLLEVASQIVPQGRIVQTVKASWKFGWKRMMTELAPQDQTGSYQRPTYSFNGIVEDRTINPNAKFPMERGRYHVFVGNPCPWCHRIRLIVDLLGLEQDGILDMTVLIDDPIKATRGGWVLPPLSSLRGTKGYQFLEQNSIVDLRGLYDFLHPNFQGRCTAPVLVDWKTKQIVSNESIDMVRCLPKLAQLRRNLPQDDTSSSSSSSTKNNKIRISADSLVPTELESKINETNEWVYRLVNNGVYRCGFSTTQDAYSRASKDVREGLQRCNTRLEQSRFLCSDTIFTESDVLLLPTLLRFDGAYGPLFRAGGGSVRLELDYPNVYRYMKDCWQSIEGVSTSIDIEDACGSYYRQLFPLNPGGIVPSPLMSPQLLGLEETSSHSN